MRKLTAWAVSICLVALIVIVAGCQCGAPTTAPETTPPTQPTTPPATPELTPALLAPTMTLYENTEHGFSIEYPEGWAENSHGAATSFYLQCNEPEGSLSVSVSVDYKPEKSGLAEAVSEGKEYLESDSQFEIFSEGDVTIGEGISGYEMIGKGDVGTGKVEKFKEIALVRDKQVFWVGVSGEPDQFDEQMQLINTIIDSFKLLSSYTYVPPAPSPGGTYTSAEYGFSITYPAGWSDHTTGQYSEILDLRAAEGIPEVMVRTWTEETTLYEAASKLKKQFSESVGDYEFLSEGEITLDDGTPAYEFVFNGTMGGYFLTCKFVVVIREADVFLVQGFSLPDRFVQEKAVLDEVIGSFHFESIETSEQPDEATSREYFSDISLGKLPAGAELPQDIQHDITVFSSVVVLLRQMGNTSTDSTSAMC
jgi:hypothetical protein